MEPAGNAGAAGHAHWTSPWSAYMLKYLAELVVNGSRTSSSFKMVHYNGCAKALQEKFGIRHTGDQVKNHLKYWQKRFRKVCELRDLSAAGWDDDNFMITLDAEHYNNHVTDHKSDADYLNKPIENFEEMHTIFGSTMATGKFAKDSGAPLGTQEESTDDWDSDVLRMEEQSDKGATHGDNAATSSASKATNPNKRDKGKKRARTEPDPLVAAIKWGSKVLAKAIKVSGKPDTDVPADLFDNLMALSGSFNQTHLSFYHSYLVANPHIARVFNTLPLEHKLNWVAKHIADNYPGQ